MRGKVSRVFPFGLALICLGAALLVVGCSSGGARFRFVQASTDVPNNVDLQVDGKTVQSGVGFGQTATYRSSTSGSHKFELFAAGTTTNPYLNSSVSLGSGDTTVIAINPFTAIALAPFTDNNTAPTTGNANLRIIHVSPTAQTIDVYVVPSGTPIAGFNPQITGLTYKNATSYLSLSAASYDVTMTVSGTQNIINSLTATYVLTAGQVRTVVVLDNQPGGGPYGLILLNDLN